MKKTKLIIGTIIVVYILSFANVSALPQYASFGNVNQDWFNIASVLENGVMIPKNQEKRVNLYDYLVPYRGIPLDNKKGFIFELLIDCSEITKYFISNEPTNNLVLYTDGNFDFAGLLYPYSISITLYRENDQLKILYMRNYNGAFNIETKSFPFNGFLSNYKTISFRVEVFQAWESSNNRYFGKINATIKSQADGYEYVIKNDYQPGFYSDGNCFVDLSNSEIRILSTIASGNWLASTKMITCIRHVYHTDSKNPWFPSLKEIQFENLNAKPMEMENTNLETYWVYSSYTLEESTIMPISFQREYSQWNDTLNETETKVFSFDFEFKTLRVNTEERRYYYSTRTIDPESWGNWQIAIYSGWFGALSYTISFNWFRNLMVMVVNAIIFMFQAILYLLIVGFNFLLLQPLFWVIVLIWNYPIYWVFMGILAIAFYLSFFFVWLWNQIVVLWKQIIEPVILWLWNEFVKAVLEVWAWLKNDGFLLIYAFILVVFTYIVSAILFVICLGVVDYNSIFEFVLTINTNLFQLIVEFLLAFFNNFLTILQAMVLYFVILGFLMLKLLFAKAKGYTSRVEKLQSAINFYKYPVDIIYRLVQTFLATKSTENT